MPRIDPHVIHRVYILYLLFGSGRFLLIQTIRMVFWQIFRRAIEHVIGISPAIIGVCATPIRRIVPMRQKKKGKSIERLRKLI